MWTELRRDTWSNALDILTEAHCGEPATVSVFERADKPRIAIAGLPFAGMRDDIRGAVRGMALFFTSSEGRPLTRFISEPEALLFERERNYPGVRLLIRTHRGPPTLIQLGEVGPAQSRDVPVCTDSNGQEAPQTVVH